MTQHSREITRDEQIAIAVHAVQLLLGGAAPTKVAIEVTRGGTCRLEVEADGGAKVAGHQWKAR